MVDLLCRVRDGSAASEKKGDRGSGWGREGGGGE